MMKKNILHASLMLMIALLSSAFAASPKKLRAIDVGVLNGPSGIPCAYLMENYEFIPVAEYGEGARCNVGYMTFANAYQLLPKLLNGEFQIGFLPPNVAAKAYSSSNGELIMCAVTGNGMLSVITKKRGVQKLSDLTGCTVSVAGQGATPEYLFKFLLKQNGIKFDGGKKSVLTDYSIPNAQLAPSLIQNKIDFALVPEPFSTVACLKDSSVYRCIDIQEEFKKATGLDSYPMTVMVANADFVKENPEVLVAFMSVYEKSVQWTKSNPAEASVLVEKHELGLEKLAAEKSIPNGAYVFVPAQEAKKSVEGLLNIFLKFDAVSIGGELPDDDFYFQR